MYWLHTKGEVFAAVAPNSMISVDKATNAFKWAVGACIEFAETVDLGGAVAYKFGPGKIKAIGKAAIIAAKVGKPLCPLYKLLIMWKKAYSKLQETLAKVGIDVNKFLPS